MCVLAPHSCHCTYGDEYRLITDLLNPDRHDRDVFPAENRSKSITVNVGLDLIQLIDLVWAITVVVVIPDYSIIPYSPAVRAG